MDIESKKKVDEKVVKVVIVAAMMENVDSSFGAVI